MTSNEWTEVSSFPEYEIHPTNGIRRKGNSKSLKGRNWIGYPKVTLMRDGKKHEKRIHKLVGEHFVPNPKGLPIVNHKDSVRSNHDAKNLEWVDNSGNQLHRWKTQKEGLKKMKYEKEYGLAKVAKEKNWYDFLPKGQGSLNKGNMAETEKKYLVHVNKNVKNYSGSPSFSRALSIAEAGYNAVPDRGNGSVHALNKYKGLEKVSLCLKKENGLSKIAKKGKSFDNIPCAGLSGRGVSCGKEKKSGLEFVYTHRARSSGYDNLGSIPLAKIKFIESTG